MIESRNLIDRETELAALTRVYDKEGFRFVIVTGRRRIGKSRLLEEFIKDRKHIRVQFERRNMGYNLMRFNESIASYENIPIPSFATFTDAFRYITRQEDIIIVLDEFSYVIKYSDVLAEFQTIVDEVLRNSKIMLIVAGSSFSIMKRSLLQYSSPLYGRADMLLNLQPLEFIHLFEWFPGLDTEQLIRIHCSCGGVPRYLQFMEQCGIKLGDRDRGGGDQGNRVIENIERSFFDPNSFLFREARELLEEEFNEPETYYSILEAVSTGNTRVVDIANHAYLEAKNAAKYLKILTDLGILKREFPYASNRKRGIYVFRDPYFAFWFLFVARYFEDIDSGHPQEAIWHFRRDFEMYTGRHFEQVAKEVVHHLLPFEPISLGRWWHRDIEIDIVAQGGQEICFIEVKWSDVSRNEAIGICAKLRQKAEHFRHDKKKVYFGLIARKLDGKEELGAGDFLVWDLEDLSWPV